MKIFSKTKSINLLLIIGMVILVVCGMLSTSQVQKIIKANIWVMHSYDVIITANAVLLTLTDAEDQLNNYALTNDKTTIKKLPTIFGLVKQKINELKNLTIDNPIQNTRINELESLANEKIGLYNQMISSGSNQNKKTISGLKKDIAKVITDFNEEELTTLIQRNQDALSEIQLSHLMIIIFGFISELFIVFSFLLINHNLRQRDRAEQVLQIQHEVMKILSESATLQEASKKVIQLICEKLDWEFGALWRLDVNHEKLFCIDIWHHPSTVMQEFEEKTREITFTRGRGLPGRVWESGKPAWIVDIANEQQCPRSELVKKAKLKSAFAFPIMMQNKVSGVVEWYSVHKEMPDTHIIELVQTIGIQIAQFTGRRAAENKLRESEEYKSAILSSASDSIITINEKNNIQLFNLQAIKEFGYTTDEINERNIETILPEFAKIISKSPYNPGMETVAKRQFGKTFPVEVKISRMNVGVRDISVLLISNITERKRVEKLKDEFVSVVSHELRTPLTSIRGALGLIYSGSVGGFSDKAKNLIEIANNNCTRLLALINDILDIEKLDAGKMTFDIKEIELNKLVRDIIEANQMYAKKFNVSLLFTSSIPEAIIASDTNRLGQVLTNLISNAVKFSPKNEDVTIHIKQHNNKVQVLISNKGPGISPEFHSQIFQRFAQADSSNTRGKGGTGLGLNITKTIIEKLGGTINYTSKPNEITTFYFELPLLKATESPASNDSEHTKILICEDDEDQARYTAYLLESAGFKVDISCNAQDAKQLLTNNVYNVLLLDLILPDQDGISFIRELRSARTGSQLPIIVLSAIAKTGQNILNEEAFPVSDWLDKPLDFDKLLFSIQQIKTVKRSQLPKILHIENDIDTFNYVKTLLENHADIVLAASIKDGIDKIQTMQFDLIILDLLLPDGHAEQVLPLISQYKLPVIVYSANQLDKNLAKQTQHVLLKSETSSEKLLNLIKYTLKTNIKETV